LEAEEVVTTPQILLVVVLEALEAVVVVKTRHPQALELPIKVLTVEQVKPQAETEEAEAVEVLALLVLMAHPHP
jgi:hypothetical protein